MGGAAASVTEYTPDSEKPCVWVFYREAGVCPDK